MSTPSLFARLALALRPRLAAEAETPTSIYGHIRKKVRDANTPIDYTTLLGEMPEVGDDAAERQAVAQRRQRQMLAAASRPAGTRGGTLLTGPAGVTTPAAAPRATLLGA
jgi:hypothetical protein